MPKKPPEIQDDAALREELEAFAAKHGLELAEPDPGCELVEREALEDDPEEADPRDALYAGTVVPEWVKRERALEGGRAQRGGGRPKKGRGPRWQEMEHLFVFGEPYRGDDGNTYVRYPALAELARRFGVNEKTVRTRAKAENWLERRGRVSQRQEEIVEEALVAQRAERKLDARSLATEACDQLLAQFAGAVREGRIEITSALDFERVARLALRLGGEADKTHKHSHTLTLEQIQERRIDSRRRHRRLPADFGAAGRGGEIAPITLPIAVDGGS